MSVQQAYSNNSQTNYRCLEILLHVFFTCFVGHFYASSAIFILFLNTVASTVDSTQKLAQSAVETGKSYATGAKGNKCYKHDIQGAILLFTSMQTTFSMDATVLSRYLITYWRHSTSTILLLCNYWYHGSRSNLFWTLICFSRIFFSFLSY